MMSEADGTFGFSSSSAHQVDDGLDRSAITFDDSIDFRVTRGGNARRLRIRTNRCTLGSGEGCTVRLDDASLRPMHAVILRDANRVLLRAYSVPIDVNGHVTGETFLHVGDCFVLGSYQFELLHEPTLPGQQDHPERSEQNSDRAASASETRGGEPIRRRGRLSFLGGNAYVSEAVQESMKESIASPRPAAMLDSVRVAHHLRELDVLKHELETLRSREREWQSAEQGIQSELDLAIERFHQSHQQADEASQAVEEMRARLSQLTTQMQQVAAESVAFREHASESQDQLRLDTKALAKARDAAIVEREEAITAKNVAIAARDSIQSQRDTFQAARDAIQSDLDAMRVERDRVVGEVAKLQAVGAIQRDDGQVETLARDLAEATEQLRASRDEVNSAHSQIIELSGELNRLQIELIAQREETRQSATQYESVVQLLQQQCDDARNSISLSTQDDAAVESLRAQLQRIETQRAQDHSSWEEEANQLQQTIRQMSMDLATATNRLGDTEAERDATQAELNDAYARLTETRSELAARPTPQQWDHLQEQLASTQNQLANAQEQLDAIQTQYEQIVQSRSTPVDPRGTALPTDAFASSPSEHEHDLWPTYQSESQDHDAAGPHDTVDRDADTDGSIADRLSSYTSHDAAQRSSLHGETDTLHRVAQRLIDHLSHDEHASDQSAVIDAPLTSRGLPNGPLATTQTSFDQNSLDCDSNSDDVAISAVPSMWNFTDSSEISKSVEADQTDHEDAPDPIAKWDETSRSSGESIANLESIAALRRHPETDLANDDATPEDNDNLLIDQTYLVTDLQSKIESDEYAELEQHGDGSGDSIMPNHLVAGVESVAKETEPVVVPLAPVTTQNDDDDSIEAYMNRLLQRVQGNPTGSNDKSAGGAAAPVVKPATAMAAIIASDQGPTTKTTEVIDPSTPIVPRSQAPEDAGHLAAMRELANASADSAISVSVRGQAEKMKSKAIVDLFQAGIVVVCAFAFYTCGLKIPTLRYVWFTAAALALALSIFFIFDGIRRLIAARQSVDKAD